jgi:hypothetical protein
VAQKNERANTPSASELLQKGEYESSNFPRKYDGLGDLSAGALGQACTMQSAVYGPPKCLNDARCFIHAAGRREKEKG